jgi:predicted nucleotidyltransferase
MEMATEHRKLERSISSFKKEILSIFGDRCISIILFGSAATPDYNPKKSDINFLIVLTDEGMKQVLNVQKYLGRWRRERISLPLFITEHYIEASLDSYPIEFLNMQYAYRLIDGKDILKPLRFKPEDMRLQCERELKGNLLKLRQGFILTRNKKLNLAFLVRRSLVSFLSIFNGLLFLKGQEIPRTRPEVLRQICHEFGLAEGVFNELLAFRIGGMKLGGSRLAFLVSQYIQQIEKLTEMVDRLEF